MDSIADTHGHCYPHPDLNLDAVSGANLDVHAYAHADVNAHAAAANQYTTTAHCDQETHPAAADQDACASAVLLRVRGGAAKL